MPHPTGAGSGRSFVIGTAPTGAALRAAGRLGRFGRLDESVESR
jgi:hypothetical protein